MRSAIVEVEVEVEIVTLTTEPKYAVLQLYIIVKNGTDDRIQKLIEDDM